MLEALKHTERGERIARRRAFANRHARALVERAGDGGIDHAGIVRDDAVHQGKIAAIDRAIADIGHKRQAGGIVFGSQHKARRVAVEAMHDAGAIAFALDIAQMLDAAMIDQGINQRAVGVIDRGMAHKPRLAWR